MSRGLGWVERFVLSWLAADERHQSDLNELSHAVAGNVDCPVCAAWGFKGDVSDATYKAVTRAVSSLERKGLVRSEHHVCQGRCSKLTRWKTVRLSVDTARICGWIQRLPCQYGYDEDAA